MQKVQRQKPLGQILLDAGLISETHLKAALTSQNRWGGRIGDHLVKAGLITDHQLLDALSLQLGVPKINFGKSHIYLDALKLVNKPTCVKFRVIPVAVKNEKGHRKLLLAMSDPTNYQAIQEIEFVTAHAVVTVIATDPEIQRAIEFCYHPDGLRESHGEMDMPEVIELSDQLIGANEEAIIISPEGEFRERDQRFHDTPLRALIDLLIDKNIITRDEFHEWLERYREEK
jgi:type IV pilus assembly protein PilB